jgi:predicted DNA-binding protein (MmcQ/YjbR family)
VKTESIEAAALLIDMGAATKAAYMHKSWVSLAEDLPEAELRARLERSYALIRAGLPKKVQAGLG